MQPNQKGFSLLQGILRVKRTEQLSPHYLRVILEGDDLANFADAAIGDNNKILIPLDKRKPLILPQGPPRLEGGIEHGFIMRTYTLRNLDLVRQEMAIDFVVHGEDPGPASIWAQNAVKDDELGVLMKKKENKIPKNPDGNYFFFGDHTALPAIAAQLQQLPAETTGSVVIEVYEPEDVIALKKPFAITVSWLFNNKPGENSQLFNMMTQILSDQPNFTYAFIAGEYKTIKAAQQWLRAQPALSRQSWLAHCYWKHGETEEASSADLRSVSTH